MTPDDIVLVLVGVAALGLRRRAPAALGGGFISEKPNVVGQVVVDPKPEPPRQPPPPPTPPPREERPPEPPPRNPLDDFRPTLISEPVREFRDDFVGPRPQYERQPGQWWEHILIWLPPRNP